MVAIYFFGIAFFIMSTWYRYATADENTPVLNRLLLAFRFQDPRHKTLDVVVMLLQYYSLSMFFGAIPLFHWLEEVYKNNNTAQYILPFVTGFFPGLWLMVILMFFYTFYWNKKK